MTPDKAKAARRMYDQRELTVAQIAEALGVRRSSVYRALRRECAVHGPTSAKPGHAVSGRG
jgi:DNA invertase Pin-like site-specific DNA recombinase